MVSYMFNMWISLCKDDVQNLLLRMTTPHANDYEFVILQMCTVQTSAYIKLRLTQINKRSLAGHNIIQHNKIVGTTYEHWMFQNATNGIACAFVVMCRPNVLWAWWGYLDTSQLNLLLMHFFALWKLWRAKNKRVCAHSSRT